MGFGYGYSRPAFLGGWLSPGVRALLAAMAGAYILQLLLSVEGSGTVARVFALSLPGLQDGRLWQFVTYMFLHAGPMHIFMNGLFLFFMGPDTERAMGTRRFVVFYLVSGVLAGAAWLLIGWARGGVCVGASGAVFGVLGAFAAFFPDRPITLLLFFVLPVTLRAKTLAIGTALLSVFFLLFGENRPVADAAHLGGIVVGYVYGSILMRRGLLGPYYAGPTWLDRLDNYWRRRKLRVVPPDEPGAPSQQEIDGILDKIASQGIDSLSRSERDVLQRASRAMQQARRP